MTRKEYETQRALGTLDVHIHPLGRLVRRSFDTGKASTEIEVEFEQTTYKLWVNLIDSPGGEIIDYTSVYDELAKRLFS